jgi:hypothetical protein
MRVLRSFIDGLNLPRMRPDNAVLKGGVPAGVTARALVEPGKMYAIYIRPVKTTPEAKQETVSALELELPAAS